MIAAASRALYRVSRGWVVLASSAVFVLFTVTVLPAQADRAKEYAGGGPTPDTSFFYSASDLYRWAEAFGADGRSDYIQARFTFDLLWPLVYTVFLATLLSWLLVRAVPATSRWRLLNLLPVLALLCDYAENVGASIVIARFPSNTPVLADLTTVFTMLKWISLSAAFALVPVVGVIALVRRGRTDTPLLDPPTPKEEAV